MSQPPSRRVLALPRVKAVLIALGLVAMGAAGAVVALRPAPQAAVAPAPTAAAAPTGSAREAALANEVHRLRARLGTVAAEKAQQGQAAEAPSAQAPQARLTEAEVEARAQARQEAVWAAIEAKLAAEAPDPTFSAGAVDHLKGVVARHQTLGTMQAVKCTATVCKLVVSHRDTEDLAGFVERISDENLLESQVLYRYDRDAQPPITTMYLSRKGHRLPVPPRS